MWILVVYVGYPISRSLDNVFYNIFVLRLKLEFLYKFFKKTLSLKQVFISIHMILCM